jgi:hypothetical protein
MRAARASALLVTVATLATICSTPFAQRAAALEPGVQVDPGSPAAKEYALPVGQARRTGRASSPSSPAQESAEATSEPLFGAGIAPAGGSGSSGGGRSAGGGRATPGKRGAVGRGSPRSKPPATTSPSPPALVRRVAAGGTSAGGGSSGLVLLAGGVVVLALGAFAGIVLRHSRRPTSAN